MTKIADGTSIAGAEIEEGKISIEAEDTDANVYLDTVRMPPLSLDEEHAVLRATGEDFQAEIGLDGHHIDALADALHDYQKELREHK